MGNAFAEWKIFNFSGPMTFFFTKLLSDDSKNLPSQNCWARLKAILVQHIPLRILQLAKDKPDLLLDKDFSYFHILYNNCFFLMIIFM